MFNNILVTGGAGFIGTHLIKKLKKQYPNSFIVSIDNYFTGKKENHIEGVNYIDGHTKDIEQLLYWHIVTGFQWKPDVVFHLGEYSRIVQSFEDHPMVWESNVIGTKAVLDYCVKHKCKIVYAGSSSKFGNNGEDENLSPYSWTKSKNIELIKNYNNWFSLDYVITYFYNVYGPGQITQGPYSTVIGIFENQFINNLPLTVVSPGTQKRDFTHVEDIVQGLILSSTKGSGDGYLLGTGINYEIIEVAKMFSDNIVFIPERKGERFTSMAYPTKAKEELGWEIKHNLKDYINQFKNNLVFNIAKYE